MPSGTHGLILFMLKTKVFILCAGEGKRLRPYTEHQPKCMVPYQGKPLLEYQLDLFAQQELRDIVLIGGYRHTLLPKQATVVVNPDYAKTNMVYSLFCAQEQMDEACDWLITYGDIIYHVSVLQAMLKANESIAVATDVDWQCYWKRRMEDPLKDAETFRWDTQTHRIIEIGKKPKTLADIQGQYIGFIKVAAQHTKVFKQAYRQFLNVHPSPKTAYMTDFLQFLIDQKIPLYGVPIHNHWAEFDTAQDLSLTLDWL